MKNLHRIMGAKFEHEKTGLCRFCSHRSDFPKWEGFCHAKGKILSAARDVKKPKCKDFIKRG